ncbi:unnamed protein product [Closterium sp. NIES-65]|nr:unnamed protein product [Closterium sp. NIES-65]
MTGVETPTGVSYASTALLVVKPVAPPSLLQMSTSHACRSVALRTCRPPAMAARTAHLSRPSRQFCPHPPLPPRALPAHSGIAVAYSTLGSPSPLISPLSPRLPSLPFPIMLDHSPVLPASIHFPPYSLSQRLPLSHPPPLCRLAFQRPPSLSNPFSLSPLLALSPTLSSHQQYFLSHPRLLYLPPSSSCLSAAHAPYPPPISSACSSSPSRPSATPSPMCVGAAEGGRSHLPSHGSPSLRAARSHLLALLLAGEAAAPVAQMPPSLSLSVPFRAHHTGCRLQFAAVQYRAVYRMCSASLLGIPASLLFKTRHG